MSTVANRRRHRASHIFDIFATEMSAKLLYNSSIPITAVSDVHIQRNGCYERKNCYELVLFVRSADSIFDLGPWISLLMAMSSEVSYRAPVALHRIEKEGLRTSEHCMLSTVRDARYGRHQILCRNGRRKRETPSFLFFSFNSYTALITHYAVHLVTLIILSQNAVSYW